MKNHRLGAFKMKTNSQCLRHHSDVQNARSVQDRELQSLPGARLLSSTREFISKRTASAYVGFRYQAVWPKP